MVEQRTKNAERTAELTALFCAGLEGNAAAYQRFLQDITPLLRSVVSKKLGIQDTEDTVQEILISIHKARHTYDISRPLMPWVMAITGFRINDALRKAYAGARYKMENIEEHPEIHENVTEADAEYEDINELLATVPAREREILTLMHLKGFTAKETGAQLGMKESAVKVAAHRAIKKLRENIGL